MISDTLLLDDALRWELILEQHTGPLPSAVNDHIDRLVDELFERYSLLVTDGGFARWRRYPKPKSPRR